MILRFWIESAIRATLTLEIAREWMENRHVTFDLSVSSAMLCDIWADYSSINFFFSIALRLSSGRLLAPWTIDLCLAISRAIGFGEFEGALLGLKGSEEGRGKFRSIYLLCGVWRGLPLSKWQCRGFSVQQPLPQIVLRPFRDNLPTFLRNWAPPLGFPSLNARVRDPKTAGYSMRS